MEERGHGVRDGLPHGVTDVSVDPDDFPQAGECDLPIAGINMGKLVAASSLDAGARSAIRVYIRLVRGPLLPYYEEALKSFVASAEEARATPADRLWPGFFEIRKENLGRGHKKETMKETLKNIQSGSNENLILAQLNGIACLLSALRFDSHSA
jgi:hypothetical protein